MSYGIMKHSSDKLTYSLTSFDFTALYDEYAGYSVPNTSLQDKKHISHVVYTLSKSLNWTQTDYTKTPGICYHVYS